MPKYKIQPEVVLGNVPEIKVPEIQVSFNRTHSKNFEGKITSSHDASGFIKKVFKSGEIELQEQFIVLYLDQSNKIIGYYKHSKGAINATVADTRIILATGLKCAAIGMIIAHNHPSGNLKPSDADIQLTKRIENGAKLHDIKLLDHLIVTKGGYYSFADEGLLGLSGVSNESNPVEGIIKYKPQVTYNSSRVTKTGKKAADGIEIRFGETKPTEEVRTLLKHHGFRFSEKQKIWYSKDNAKSKEFAQQLLNSEVDVDDTKYEKLSFWARVKSYHEYQRFYNHTQFFVKGDPGQNFFTKGKLETAYPNVHVLISNGSLAFKKHFNKAVDDDEIEIPGTSNRDSDTNSFENSNDDELLELEAQAELELLKIRVEIERMKSKTTIKGLSGINQTKLNMLKQKAWIIKNEWEVLNFK